MIISVEQLETERLILRDWRNSDLQALHYYCKNPNVGPNAGWKPHTSISESRVILNGFITNGEVWAIALKENDTVIGSLGIHRDRKRMSGNIRTIGYSLSEEFWNQGYMTEAVKRVLDYLFNTLYIELAAIYHFDFNTASRRVIEKCGFTYEGIIRKSIVLYDGSVLDEVSWSMTRDEYLNNYGL